MKHILVEDRDKSERVFEPDNGQIAGDGGADGLRTGEPAMTIQ